MAAARYLVKAGSQFRGRNSVVIADELAVEHPIKYRGAETYDSPLGRIRRMESTGKRDRRRFRFIVRKGTLGNGNETSRSRHQTEAQTTAAATKKIIRRLRPQDAERIDRISEKVAEAEAIWKVLRDKRDEAVREAFSKGHVVRVSELEEMATDFERDFEERKQLLNSLPGLSTEELYELLESDRAKSEQYVADRIREELEGRR